ncbi:MAG: PfkB family carbohydrate kinase, partial [Trebonia sp.]
MIAVIGEALIDLVVDEAGAVVARPGGGPFNTARTLGRLGVETTFLGRLSGDRFGRTLRERLAADGVALGVPTPAGR